jgi:DNA-binding LytR/AlgR family response regulator
VSNASAALELIEAGRGFDLVFSDIIMPGGMSGLDLAQRVREIRPGLPVLLATGYSHSVQTGAARGFSIIAKPYTAASLATAIQALENA